MEESKRGQIELGRPMTKAWRSLRENSKVELQRQNLEEPNSESTKCVRADYK